MGNVLQELREVKRIITVDLDAFMRDRGMRFALRYSNDTYRCSASDLVIGKLREEA